mmetsp:Transcript_121166/g.220319  ORF Transcript_121166/g.220319 Transcript_121166/m.220319 type:complete len:873 (+) Transcript_121166:83-2701(+)
MAEGSSDFTEDLQTAFEQLRLIDESLSGTDAKLDSLSARLAKLDPAGAAKDGPSITTREVKLQATGLQAEPLLSKGVYMQKAAWHYTDAGLHHVFHDHYPAEPAAWTTFISYAAWKRYSEFAVVILLTLTFFEIPLWCDVSSGFWRFSASSDVCVIKDSHKGAILSGIPLLPVGVAVLIEACCYTAWIGRFVYHQQLEKFFKHQPYQKKQTTYLETAFVLIGVADVIYYACNWTTDFRVAHFVRFALAATGLKSIRKLCFDFVKILWEIRNTGIILVGLIFFWAWLMTILFDDVTDEVFGDPINTGFKPFTYGLYTSFLTSTTVNLPGDMVAMYSWHRVLGWLWFVMIVLGCLIISQVIFAVVYAKYQEMVTEDMKSIAGMRKEAIDKTFDNLLLAEGAQSGQTMKEITEQTFHEFCDQLEEVPGVVVKTEQQESICFQWLDSGNSGSLSSSEFKKITNALLCNIRVTPAKSWVQEAYGETPFIKKLTAMCLDGENNPDGTLGAEEDCYTNSTMDNTMTYVLLANIVLIGYESFVDLNSDKVTEHPITFAICDCFFALLYLIEVAIKFCVWSWSEYIYTVTDKFDLGTSVSLAIGGVYTLTTALHDTKTNASNPHIVLTFLRLVRVMKALERVDAFQKVLTCIKRMLKTCWDVLLMNLFVMYLWAAWGMLLFGGKFYEESPGLQAGVDAGDLDPDGDIPIIEVFNFNDMIMGLNTLFISTITAYLDMVAAGSFYIYARGSGGWWMSYIFHYTYYVASPVLVFNIFSAFSIDVYCKLTEEEDECDEFLKDFRKMSMEKASDGGAKVIHIQPTTELRQVFTLRDFFKDELEGDDDDDEGGDKEDGKDDDKKEEDAKEDKFLLDAAIQGEEGKTL